MRILLVDPAPAHFYNYKELYEHLGLGYLASVLRAEGHEVNLLSSYLERLSVRKTVERIKAQKPDVVGFSIKEIFARRVFQIIQKMRQAGVDAHITLGGHYPTFNHSEILRDFPEVNSVVRGEGEETVRELVSALENGSDFRNIAGLSFRRGEQVIINAPRDLNQDLDSLPFPARDLTPMVLEKSSNISLITSRGCYANCSFCSIQSFYRLSRGRLYRRRSAKNVVDEIESLIERFNCRSFRLDDDQFIGPGKKGRAEAEELAQEIFKRNLNIQFQISCRVNDVNLELFEMLKEAGLERIFLGLESAHQRGLDTFNKGITVTDNWKAIHTLNKLGISYVVAFILIDPYTTFGELSENISFLSVIKPQVAQRGGLLSVELKLTPHRGTPIFARLQQEERLHGNYVKGYRYRLRDVRVIFFAILWKTVEKGILPFIFKLRVLKRARGTLAPKFWANRLKLALS